MKYYCGPDWLPQIFRKWLSKKFNLACRIHDEDYETKLRETRFKSDKFFLNVMIGDSQCDKDVFWAVVYYIFVRLFAKGRWRNC